MSPSMWLKFGIVISTWGLLMMNFLSKMREIVLSLGLCFFNKNNVQSQLEFFELAMPQWFGEDVSYLILEKILKSILFHHFFIFSLVKWWCIAICFVLDWYLDLLPFWYSLCCHEILVLVLKSLVQNHIRVCSAMLIFWILLINLCIFLLMKIEQLWLTSLKSEQLDWLLVWKQNPLLINHQLSLLSNLCLHSLIVLLVNLYGREFHNSKFSQYILGFFCYC